MRNHGMARPAHLASLAALVCAAHLFVAGSIDAALAQDFLAPPPGAITSGDEPGDDRDMEQARLRDEEDGSSEAERPGPGSEQNIKSPFSQNANARPEPGKSFSPEASAKKAAEPSVQEQSSAPAQSASRTDPSQPPIQVATHGGENDIFDQWAAKKLRHQRILDSSKPHPLAAKYPGQFVVVCEAGCRNDQQQIVYMEPRDARGPVFETSKQNTQAESDVVACVGGCYRSGPNQPIYHVNTIARPSEANSWLTTTVKVHPSGPAAKTSERWYDRMNDSTAKKDTNDKTSQ